MVGLATNVCLLAPSHVFVNVSHVCNRLPGGALALVSAAADYLHAI